jgi:hypothetical protein
MNAMKTKKVRMRTVHNKRAVAICDRLRNLNVENNSWFWFKNSSLFPSSLGEGVPMKSGRMRLINTLQRHVFLQLIIVKSF